MNISVGGFTEGVYVFATIFLRVENKLSDLSMNYVILVLASSPGPNDSTRALSVSFALKNTHINTSNATARVVLIGPCQRRFKMPTICPAL
jgi:hypothetical protein